MQQQLNKKKEGTKQKQKERETVLKCVLLMFCMSFSNSSFFPWGVAASDVTD